MVLLTGLLLMVPALSWAQLDSTAVTALQAVKGKGEVVKPIPFKERWAFKVNTVDWVLLMPNVGVEFDLSGSPMSHYTLGASVRYNGKPQFDSDQRFDFQIFDAKVELRRYWHPSLKMKRDQKRKPKFWRTYYWGLYAGYTDYTLYMSKGFKGSGVNVGASFGCEVSLLSFKHGGLDLDLGLSAGGQYGKYDKSEMDGDVRRITKTEGWGVIPFPLLQEVRVGLVYRFKSVRDKYGKKRH